MSGMANLAAWAAEQGEGGPGVSAMALGTFVLSEQPGVSRRAHPYDADDFGRCLKVVKEVPEVGEALARARDMSPRWAGLIDQWSTLEAAVQESQPDATAKVRAAMNDAVNAVVPVAPVHARLAQAMLRGDRGWREIEGLPDADGRTDSWQSKTVALSALAGLRLANALVDVLADRDLSMCSIWLGTSSGSQAVLQWTQGAAPADRYALRVSPEDLFLHPSVRVSVTVNLKRAELGAV